MADFYQPKINNLPSESAVFEFSDLEITCVKVSFISEGCLSLRVKDFKLWTQDSRIIIHHDSLAKSTEPCCELYILYFVAVTLIVVLSVLS